MRVAILDDYHRAYDGTRGVERLRQRNTARGPIVDETALCDALAGNRIAGAGLDVFDRKPLPPGHWLTKLPNAVLTSHLGWPTDEMYSKFAEAAADVLIDYLDGREVARFVDHS
jgi:phosphoglycerate dehydrogenase-like enzyme